METKFILKKVAETLIQSKIIYRKKMGFDLPVRVARISFKKINKQYILEKNKRINYLFDSVINNKDNLKRNRFDMAFLTLESSMKLCVKFSNSFNKICAR